MTESQIKDSFEACAERSYFLGGQGWSFQKSTGLCKITRNTTKIENDPDWISGTGRCYKGQKYFKKSLLQNLFRCEDHRGCL